MIAADEAAARDPALLAGLADAHTGLETSALVARRLRAVSLAESIAAVGLEANDLMRMQLRRLRIAAKLTQAEVAERIGSPRRAISDFETGRRPILPEFMRQLSAAVGIVAPPAFVVGTPSVMQRVRTAVAGEEARAFEVVATGISMEPSIHHGDRLL